MVLEITRGLRSAKSSSKQSQAVPVRVLVSLEITWEWNCFKQGFLGDRDTSSGAKVKFHIEDIDKGKITKSELEFFKECSTLSRPLSFKDWLNKAYIIEGLIIQVHGGFYIPLKIPDFKE